MKNDIKIHGNIISGRQGWAYICNSMKFAVLKADMSKEQEYEDYKRFDKVRVAKEYRNHELVHVGQLEVNKGKWSIGGWGCCISADFGFSDMMKSVEESNMQVVRKGDIVAIALIMSDIEFVSLMLFRAGAIDMNCMTMTDLTPLTDEEMQEVKEDAERWCNR